MTGAQGDTARIFRVVLAHERDDPFAASQRNARWTSKAFPVVYASLSAGGAMMEFLVHRESTLTEHLSLATAHIPAHGMHDLSALPPCWEERPYRKEVQAVGNAWLEKSASLALRVPSAVCPGESNVLINPMHPDFAMLAVTAVRSFNLDSRLG